MTASVLIVDKNRFSRHMLREVLEQAGYRVSAVATTSFARSLVGMLGEQFDLVLLHARTSAGDNAKFCSDLRADGFDPPIMVLSEDLTELREAAQAGASASIQTPFTIKALLRQVEASLNQHPSTPGAILHRPRFHSASRRQP